MLALLFLLNLGQAGHWHSRQRQAINLEREKYLRSHCRNIDTWPDLHIHESSLCESNPQIALLYQRMIY